MRTILAAAALLVAGPVGAVETFDFAYTGTLTHFFDAHECATCIDPATRSWSGLLELTTADNADGVYSGNAVTITIDGRPLDFQLMPMSVTVRNDQVVSIDGSSVPFPLWTFAGMGIAYADRGADHVGPTYGSALLAAIGEPPALVLLALGLGVLAIRRGVR